MQPQNFNFPSQGYMSGYQMGFPHRENFVKHDLRKIKTDSKKEDKKYDFLFHINYNNILVLSDMNPIRTKKLRDLDASGQSYIKRVDDIIEKNSTRLKELKAVAEDTKQKLDTTLSTQIKKFGIELKDIAEKLRSLNDFAKSTSDEFDFYRVAVKSYEDILARIRTDQKINWDIPSKALLDLIKYLEGKVNSIRFMLNDLVDTIKDIEDFDMRVDNSATLYERLMTECEIAFGQLLEKAHDVLYMVRKTRVRIMGNQKPRDMQTKGRIEEEKPNGSNIEDIIKRRLDKVISNFNN